MATHIKKHNKLNYNKELILCNEKKNEFYSQIVEPKGGARFVCKLLINNLDVISKAAGRLIKGPNKQKIFKNDFVLLQKDNDKYYIIHKYLNEDVKKLIKMNEITNIIGIMNEIDDDENKNDIDILFGDDVAANKKVQEIDETFINNL